MGDKFIYEYSSAREEKTKRAPSNTWEMERIREKYLSEAEKVGRKTKSIDGKAKLFSVTGVVLHALLGLVLLAGGILIVLDGKMTALGSVQILGGWYFIACIYLVYKKIYKKLKARLAKKSSEIN